MDGVLLEDQGADRDCLGRIGPNSVVQLGHAVTDRFGREAAERLYRMAGQLELLREPPADMIDEALPARLFKALWRAHPDAAPELAADAGRRTADYVIANRLPRAARIVFAIAPRAIGARLLLKAVARNAWTFVGSGRCETQFGRPILISIRDNPLIMPDCAWHAAVFERLFERLVARGARVRHTGCCRLGARSCRFEILLPLS